MSYDAKRGSQNEERVTSGSPEVHPKGVGGSEPKNDSNPILDKGKTLFPMEEVTEKELEPIQKYA